ncbi:pyruvate carboxyltransferase [Streptomyces cellostaticus]|uniref:2-isopropylmalate synthase n=1 Tax=Streptomyces cellostaticus TaxID=67285 RepID=A0A117PWH2_9ACTN|nr:pyruvate carboxyltransferase [Streptomyces cellostaticus]KUM95676.1 pyruvate carboxyltransferase [Streptomyces cellostaticus]
MGSDQPRGPRRISVFDTTLRDGEQAPGNAMSARQKLEIALALEALGVDVIEAGFPSSSADDFQALRLISDALTTARVSSLTRACRDDIQAAVDAAGVERHHIQVMVTGSDIHLRHKRGITREEGLREAVEALRFARSLGLDDMSLAIEDASRGADDLLRPLIEAGLAEGAGTVVLADTTGHMVPAEFGSLVARVRSWIPDRVTLSVHCHHDMGLSLANALAGIEAGADEVQTTLAGIGERAGNTPLEELAAVLAYKGDRFGATTSIDTTRLYEAFGLLCRTIGLVPPRNKAIFGDNAFATQAGIHQAGILRNPVTYEYVEPERFGRTRSLLVGRHSGRAVIRHLLGELGVPFGDALVESVYQEHVADRSDGTCLSADDLKRLLQELPGLRADAALSQTGA